MTQVMASFCFQQAKRCRAFAENATSEGRRVAWLEAEARWLRAEVEWAKRFTVSEPSESGAEAEVEKIDSRGRLLAISQTAPLESSESGSGIDVDGFSNWFERFRMNLLSLSREDLRVHREQAKACRNAAESAKSVDTREYWLTAEAHWLALAEQLQLGGRGQDAATRGLQDAQ